LTPLSEFLINSCMTNTPSRLRALCVSSTLALALPLAGEAAVIAYDGFNSYATGDLGGNNGGSGWTSSWASATSANDVAAGGLSYSNGSITVSGGANTMVKSGTGGGATGSTDPFLSRSFTLTTSSEVWFSFLFNNTNLSSGSADLLNFYLSDSADNTSTRSGGFLAPGGSGIGFAARITTSGGTLINGSSASFSTHDGTTTLLVGRLSTSGTSSGSGSNYDLMQFWLNPTSLTLGTATSQVDADTGASSLSYFGVRTNNVESSDVFYVDELRIGTSATDVVPEPNAVLFVVLGVSALLVPRRRMQSDRRI
jgi:hypothetical protein